jgi:hypothetical protein
MVRMFIVYHGHQHGTILRRSARADILLRTYGLLLLTPPSIWRRTHADHHSHNGRLQAAGVWSFRVMTTRAFARASRRWHFAYALSRHPLTILAGYATPPTSPPTTWPPSCPTTPQGTFPATAPAPTGGGPSDKVDCVFG